MDEVAALVIEAGGRRCAIACAQLREVLPEPLLDPVPAAAPMLAGLMTLAGHPVPVIDLGMLFGAPDPGPVSAQPYRHLLLTGADDALLAWRVARVHDMRRLDRRRMRPVAAEASINGCVTAEVPTEDGVLRWLDLDRLLLAEERQRLEALRSETAARLGAWS
jgi:purine-binding chemotaxis protein CheW